MTTSVADKINQTKSSFPPEPPGAVARCPQEKPAVKTEPSPVEVKTALELTQSIMKTLSGGQREKPKTKTAWIEIILVDAEGNPVPGVRYRITPPGGKPVEGRLNEHGQAGLYGIEPGDCKITFPDLDKDAWD